jgi:hypothetical protein
MVKSDFLKLFDSSSVQKNNEHPKIKLNFFIYLVHK